MNDQKTRIRRLAEVERWHIERAVYVLDGNLTAAAESLGIGRTTIYRKLQEYRKQPQSAFQRLVAEGRYPVVENRA